MRFATVMIVLFCTIIGAMPVAHAFDTESKDFSKVGSWKVTAEHSEPMGGRWCRAVGQFDVNDITILLGQLASVYGRLSLQVTMHQHRLPEGYEGDAALFFDGMPAASGKIQDVGDWQGGKRTAFYSRASFNKIDELQDKLRHAHKLVINGDAKIFKPVELNELELDKVMSELQRCLQ